MRNLKKVLSLALALVMLLGMMVVGAGAATSFSDDDKIADSRKVAVAVANKIGVLQGVGDNTFNPDGTLTRAEAAVVLAKLDLGADAAKALTATNAATFDDVGTGYGWAKAYIDYCAGNGYMVGVGGNNFAPGRTLTSVEFATMVSRVLGYKDENEYGKDGWTAVKAAALARKAGLGADVAVANADMSRADMAQMVLNALTAPLVEYEGLNVSVNGVSLTSNVKVRTHTGSSSLGVANTTYDYEPIQANITPIRLCEEKFPDLKLTTKSYDDFGRDYSVWTWKNVEINGSDTLVTPDALFTAETTESAVKGKTNSASAISATVYRNGKDTEETVTAKAIADMTGNGREVYVYLNTANNKLVDKVVVIDTFVGRVSSVNSSKGTINVAALTKVENSTLDGAFETTDFASKEVVLYTAAWVSGSKYAVETVDHLGEPTTGILTKWVGTSVVTDKTKGESDASFTVDSGDPYSYNPNVYVVDENDAYLEGVWKFTPKKSEINVYVDKYGYAIYVSGVEGTKNYAAVIGTGSTNPYGDETTGVTLLLPDSTRKSVTATLAKTTDKFTRDNGTLAGGSAQKVTDLIGDLVTYVEKDDGTYELTIADNWDVTNVNNNARTKFTNGKSELKLGASTYYATSKTIFFVATGATNNVAYNVYTGYNAMPSFKTTGITGFAVKTNSRNQNQVDAVYIAASALEDNNVADTYFVKAKDAYIHSDSTGSYYILPAVVDGEVTEIKLDATKSIGGIDWTNNKIQGLFAVKSVKTNADGIVYSFVDARNTVFGTVGRENLGVVAADGVVLGVGTSNTKPSATEAALRNSATYWAYTDSTKAFYVDKNYKTIELVEIGQIDTDLNDKVCAGVKTVNGTDISLTDVFVIRQDDNTGSSVTEIPGLEVDSSAPNAAGGSATPIVFDIIKVQSGTTVTLDDIEQAVVAKVLEIHPDWTYDPANSGESDDGANYIVAFKNANGASRYAQFAMSDVSTPTKVIGVTDPSKLGDALANNDEIILDTDATLTGLSANKKVVVSEGNTLTLGAGAITGYISGEGDIAINGAVTNAGNISTTGNIVVGASGSFDVLGDGEGVGDESTRRPVSVVLNGTNLTSVGAVHGTVTVRGNVTLGAKLTTNELVVEDGSALTLSDWSNLEVQLINVGKGATIIKGDGTSWKVTAKCDIEIAMSGASGDSSLGYIKGVLDGEEVYATFSNTPDPATLKEVIQAGLRDELFEDKSEG